MTIFPPTSEADPAYWAAVFGGHMAVGLVLCAVFAATVGRWWFTKPAVAGAETAIVVYGVAWEGLWQGLGAGLGDATLDTFAVACGAICAAAAWQRKGPVLAGAIVAATAVLVRGIRRRL